MCLNSAIFSNSCFYKKNIYTELRGLIMKKFIFLLLVFGSSVSVNANSENCISSFESEDYQKA